MKLLIHSEINEINQDSSGDIQKYLNGTYLTYMIIK